MISAEIPDENVDKGLYDIVVKNMIHGPCGALNEKSPCMAKGRCTKQYPRLLVPNTITSNDGYPQYRRRSTEQKQGKSVDGQPTIYKDTTIGRLYTFHHPNQHECFFLRLLLVNVPGPTSFEYLKTVNGIIHGTYRSACQALNLLEWPTLGYLHQWRVRYVNSKSNSCIVWNHTNNLLSFSSYRVMGKI